MLIIGAVTHLYPFSCFAFALRQEQVHEASTGAFDRGRGGAGGQSNRKVRKKFVNALHNQVGVGVEVSMDSLRNIAANCNCQLQDVQPMLEELRESGILIMVGTNKWKVMN